MPNAMPLSRELKWLTFSIVLVQISPSNGVLILKKSKGYALTFSSLVIVIVYLDENYFEPGQDRTFWWTVQQDITKNFKEKCSFTGHLKLNIFLKQKRERLPCILGDFIFGFSNYIRSQW